MVMVLVRYGAASLMVVGVFIGPPPRSPHLSFAVAAGIIVYNTIAAFLLRRKRFPEKAALLVLIADFVATLVFTLSDMASPGAFESLVFVLVGAEASLLFSVWGLGAYVIALAPSLALVAWSEATAMGQAISPGQWVLMWSLLLIVLSMIAVLTEQQQRLRAELSRLATTDPLTGLFNRRVLNERLESEIRRAQRSSASLSLLALDLDHFKQVNDSLGHDAGDHALTALARVLGSQTRAGIDSPARTGGEEFVALLPDTDLAGAIHLAERIRDAVRRDPNLLTTVSIGVAQWDPGEGSGSLLSAADRALYSAKSAGRDCVRARRAHKTMSAEAMPRPSAGRPAAAGGRAR